MKEDFITHTGKHNKQVAQNIGKHFHQMLNLFFIKLEDRDGKCINPFGEIKLFISFADEVTSDIMAPRFLTTQYLLTIFGKKLEIEQLPEDNEFSFPNESHNVPCRGQAHLSDTKYEIVFSTKETNILLDFLIYRFDTSIPIIMCDEKSTCDYNGIIDQAIRSYLSSFFIDTNMLILLSSQKYESIDAHCNLVWTYNPEHQGNEPTLKIKLLDPFEFLADNIRQVRKFAEIAKAPLALSIDGFNKVVGFEEINARNNVVKVEIYGHLSFTFTYRNMVINYKNGVFRFLIAQNIEYYLKSSLGLNDDYFDIINKITAIAKEQGHGTVLVFGNKESIKYSRLK